VDFALAPEQEKSPPGAAQRKVFMKKVILIAAGVGILVGFGFYAHQPKREPEVVPEAKADSAPAAEEFRSVEPATPRPEPAVVAAAMPATSQAARLVAPSRPNLDTAMVSRAVELLTSSQVSYLQKREAWKQLRDAGKLDQAIAQLEQLNAGDSRNAEYPAALGQAYLKKCGTIQDLREQGILAMQADKLFDAALSLDAANWEARFTKAVALTYWPPNLNKGEEVIQHFQTLIQQQETQPPQPEFAEPYAWLGEQYQKAGRTEDARTVWQRGATLFPADEKLRTKLTSNP
jgi:tetratricopeptide (TPR) repeat protein